MFESPVYNWAGMSVSWKLFRHKTSFYSEAIGQRSCFQTRDLYKWIVCMYLCMYGAASNKRHLLINGLDGIGLGLGGHVGVDMQGDAGRDARETASNKSCHIRATRDGRR